MAQQAVFPYFSSVALGPEYGQRLYTNLLAAGQQARGAAGQQFMDQASTDPANAAAGISGMAGIDRGFDANALQGYNQVSGQLMGEDATNRRTASKQKFQAEQANLDRTQKEQLNLKQLQQALDMERLRQQTMTSIHLMDKLTSAGGGLAGFASG